MRFFNERLLPLRVWLLVLAGMPGMPASAAANKGIWIGDSEIAALPTTGAAWRSLKSAADRPVGTPDLSDQEDDVNVRVLAKALVFARTGIEQYRTDVIGALQGIVDSRPYSGRALALGRELGAYVVAADLISLETANPTLDARFRAKLKQLRTTYTHSGPISLIACHELRPNNWGNHCGASRLAVALYLGDTADVDRAAAVFRGYLGDRASHARFKYGELSWQADPSRPVGINPKGAAKSGHSIDGVLPDDQRRAGSLTWPPPRENYVYEGLQGALAQAIMLSRAGYDVWSWQDKALLRAFQWLHDEADFPAVGDDTWQPYVINHFYGTHFPAPSPSRPGKWGGFTDWTLAGKVASDGAESSARP
jgi:hypothetical protein